jgi:hypothetical protein
MRKYPKLLHTVLDCTNVRQLPVGDAILSSQPAMISEWPKNKPSITAR